MRQFDHDRKPCRRTVICGLAGWAAASPTASHAQKLPWWTEWTKPPSYAVPAPWWAPWRKIPSVTAVSAEDDVRLPLVAEALDFWNAQLLRLNIVFRLGPVTHLVGMVPAADIQAVRRTTSSRRVAPDSIAQVPGDVVVVLSDASFQGFAFGWAAPRKVLAAIPSDRVHPNVESRNVIAHELGHAIGLGHDDHPNSLMCGGPWCHSIFPSEGFFALTEADAAKLLELYPQNWQPERGWKTDPPLSHQKFG
jgi:hypothetical protein